MATILQQQLAAISAKSTDQLNLKAQKTRHAQSLLFEPKEAAGQSFETLFQICNEGFEDLCHLDTRFRTYSTNLFAPTSLDVEREQLTARENKDLDGMLERFFGLVSGRLLLRPALKSVEWLVRRFRVHELNTATLIYTFLPYHQHDVFPTLLSILPKDLPKLFNFLRPYAAALSSPPRHAIISATTRTPALFVEFSAFVLRIAKRRQHSAALVSFWASVAAQTVSGMLDAADAGREAVRREKTDDVLMRILPIIQEALNLSKIPEMYSTACIMIAIVAGEAELDDTVLDTMMEALAITWHTETVEEGILSLSLLAERKNKAELAPSVVKAVLLLPGSTIDSSFAQADRYRSSKFALGLALGAIDLASSKNDTKYLEQATNLAQIAHFSSQHKLAFGRKLLSLESHEGLEKEREAGLQMLLADESVASQLEQIAQKEGYNLGQLQIEAPKADTADAESEDVEMDDVPTFDAQQIVDALPSLQKDPLSFLSQDSEASKAFDAYSKCFETLASNDLGPFLDAPALHRKSALERPEYLSFLAREWTTSTRSVCRAKALTTAAKAVSTLEEDKILDLQALVPYILAALRDTNKPVRSAAAGLALAVTQCIKGATKNDAPEVWCKKSFYSKKSASSHWLESVDMQKFLTVAITPVLEDCVLDAAFLDRSFPGQLNGSDMKSTTRSAVCSFLASHAAVSSILPVRLTAFNILSHVGKAASQARKDVLVPLLKHTTGEKSQIDDDFAQALLKTISHRSGEEVEALKSVAVTSRASIYSSAFARLSELFPAMKPQSQMSVAEFLLDQSLVEDDRSVAATETLRNVRLSPDVQAHLLETVPGSSTAQEQERPSKRQRTNKGTPEKPKSIDPSKLSPILRKATIVLELIDGSKAPVVTNTEEAQAATKVLKGLFHLLGELHQWKSATGSDMGYLQTLLLGNLLAVVGAFTISTAKDLDRAVIRTDLIVETLRSTSSPQVHNTALLVISKLATFVPETVLHSVMPLFTFMSSNTLRQTDRYSAHVVDMTVQSVVPPLAASLKNKGKDLVAGAAELLLSFTAAFEHIPLHRRVNTFTQLVRTLGPEETMYAVTAMLVERYKEDTTLESFVRDLMNAFPVKTQLQSTKQYLDLIFDACRPKRKLADAILGFGEKNPAEIHESVAVLLEGVHTILQNQQLRKKLAGEIQTDPATAEQAREVYGQILEQVISLPTSKLSVSFEEPRIKRVHESVLSALLNLLPTEDFINSSASLMQAGSEQVRRQVFTSLTVRAEAAKPGNTELAKVFIDVLPGCTAFLTTDQPVPVRHASLQCIDSITEKYGKIDREACAAAAEVVAGDAALASKDDTLRVSAMLCLASMVEVLGEDFVRIAPGVLKYVLLYADTALVTDDPKLDVYNAAFSFVNAVLDHSAWLLDAQDLNTCLVFAGRSLDVFGEESEPESAFRSLVARKVDTTLVFSTLLTSFVSVREEGPTAIKAHVSMLQEAIKHRTKAVIVRHANTLFPVLMQALDLRRHFVGETDPDIQDAYQITCQTAIDMTLKLNDTTFRPFFIRLVSWAAEELPSDDEDGRTQRSIALYNFTCVLFEQLGSIVTSYSGFILEHLVAVLEAVQTSPTHSEAMQDLLSQVLATLSASFRHDQDDFWAAPQHFDSVSTPLLNLLSLEPTVPSANLRPVIADLAMAVSGSIEHVKVINNHLLRLLKHDEAPVRLAAVKTMKGFADVLGDGWLNLLPESLPLMSETLEDGDEKVEKAMMAWVRELEESTGEEILGMMH